MDVVLRAAPPGEPTRASSAWPVANLDQPLTFDVRNYDHLLLVDVLSRVHRPEEFMDTLRAQFDDRPRRLVLSVANVAFVVQRSMLAAGQFNYARAGTLDREHVRLFTLRAVKHLLRDAGFRITRVRGVPAPFPRALGDNRLSRALIRANQVLIRVSKTLFAYEFVIEADGTPDMSFRLADTLSTEVVGTR